MSTSAKETIIVDKSFSGYAKENMKLLKINTGSNCSQFKCIYVIWGGGN